MQALESYSSHLEPTFVKIALPPTGPNQSIPPNFDLSPSYVDRLDEEFTRVYEEYTRRVATVKSLAEQTIQLWAELGTPQAQTDAAIVKYYRDAPEQLGLHEEDIARLRAKRDRLSEEKKGRERRLKELKAAVEALWLKLGIEEKEQKAFLNGNRGCGIRQINEFEDELARLNELKRQNLHLFVEDARFKLQELWDALYLSEDEMLEFTPAFSDVYSDALLEAHEQEIARLEALREQRAPMLALVDRHKTLIAERNELQASSQDASRLMMRGQKGEKRDPTRLLREEKMRKRIAKELPKVSAELSKALEKWEDEYGMPFLVHGERYLDVLEAEAEAAGGSKNAPGPRSKTPAGPPQSAAKGTASKSAPASRANSVGKAAGGTIAAAMHAPSRSLTKTPTAVGTAAGNRPRLNTAGAAAAGAPSAISKPAGSVSPSKIPARVPLSNLKHGQNSPERPRPDSRAAGPTTRSGAPIARAPPPKMRGLVPNNPAPELQEMETPVPHRGYGRDVLSSDSSVNVRHVEPEDVYYQGGSGYHQSGQMVAPPSRTNSAQDYYHHSLQQQHSREHSAGTIASSHHSTSLHAQRQQQRYGQAPTPYVSHHHSNSSSRHASQTSHVSGASGTSSAVSGSENWETYDDASSLGGDELLDTASEAGSSRYCGRVRDGPRGVEIRGTGGGKRASPGTSAGFGASKRLRGGPGVKLVGSACGGEVYDAVTGERVVSGDGWEDEDAF